MSNVASLLLNPNRQLLINGSDLFDQRFVNTKAYTAALTEYVLDRWLFDFDEVTAGASTIRRQAFLLGGSFPDGTPYPENYCEWNHVTSSGDGTYIRMSQRIASVRQLAGGKATFSLYAKADAAHTIGFQVVQNFGTGGSPSSPTLSAVQSRAVTTGWQRFSITFDVPSISGQNIGTNGDDYVEIRIIPPVNTSFVLDTALKVMIAGDTAQPFQLAGSEKRNELGLCTLFYEKSYNIETAVGTATTVNQGYGDSIGTGTIVMEVNFSRKRSVAVGVLYSPVTGTAARIRDEGGATDRVANPVNPGESRFSFIVGGSTASTTHAWHWTAEAEL